MLRKFTRTVCQLAIFAEQNVLNSVTPHGNHNLLLLGLFHVSTVQLADPGWGLPAILLQTILGDEVLLLSASMWVGKYSSAACVLSLTEGSVATQGNSSHVSDRNMRGKVEMQKDPLS